MTIYCHAKNIGFKFMQKSAQSNEDCNKNANSIGNTKLVFPVSTLD